MVIRVGHKKTVARAIEWSDAARKQPICFILKCPHCQATQWVNKDKHLYVATDNSRNNYRCRVCHTGADKKWMWVDRPTPVKVFRPKCPGWRSIDFDT